MSVKIKDCIAVVAAHYGMSEELILSRTHARTIAHPRQLAMWLAREMTNNSLTAIGTHFGDYHHTTVMHALGRVNKRRQQSPEYSAMCTALVVRVQTQCEDQSLAMRVHVAQMAVREMRGTL